MRKVAKDQRALDHETLALLGQRVGGLYAEGGMELVFQKLKSHFLVAGFCGVMEPTELEKDIVTTTTLRELLGRESTRPST